MVEVTGEQWDEEQTPEPRSWEEELARQLGLTTRYAVGGPVKLFTGLADAIEPYLDLVVPGEMEPITPKVDQVLDKIFPSPEGRVEEYVGSASEFLTSAAPTLKGAQVLSRSPILTETTERVADVMTKGPTAQAISSVAGGLGLEAPEELGLPEATAPLVSLIASLLPGFGGAALSSTVRGAGRGKSGVPMQEKIETMESAGLDPTVEATGAPGAARVSAGASRIPGGGGPRDRRVQSNVDKFSDRVEQVGEGAPVTLEATGTEAVRGMERWVERTRLRSEGLYDEAMDLIDEEGIVDLGNTRASISADEGLAGVAPETARKLNSKWLQDLGIGLDEDIKAYLESTGGNIEGLPYYAVRRLRTEIGRKIEDDLFNPDVNQAELKRLYGALSEDLKGYVSTQGDDAAQAASRADTYYKARMERMENVRKIVNKAGGPEMVWNFLMGRATKGGTDMRTILKSMTPDERDLMGRSVINRLGQATPGRATPDNPFSIETYLTNWNKLSPEAKDILFTNPQIIEDTDVLARAAGHLREANQAAGNPSGTGQAVAAGGVGAGLGAGLTEFAATGSISTIMATLATIGGANLTSRLMNNPRFVHWMARSTTIPEGSEVMAWRELAQIAHEENDVALLEALNELRKRMRSPEVRAIENEQWNE